MSHVLDFIITASILEEKDTETETTQDRMHELKSVIFREFGTLFDSSIPPAHRVDPVNGGNAAMQNRVYIGAINRWIRPEELRQAVLKVKWISPDDVRVFICDEGWNAFEPLPLDRPFERALPGENSCHHDLPLFDTADEAVAHAISSASGIWRGDVKALFCGIQCPVCGQFFVGIDTAKASSDTFKNENAC